MNESNNLVSIVIPIYNESESIELLTREIIKVMNSNNIYFELILVNDGSNDSTLHILDKLSNICKVESLEPSLTKINSKKILFVCITLRISLTSNSMLSLSL